MPGLQEVFARTGGPDPTAAAVPQLGPSRQFLSEFNTGQFTGANGAGPILNANAVLMPSIAANHHDSANSNDFRLGNGLATAKAIRKPDSLEGQTSEGFQGLAKPNKLMGRSSVGFDLNWNREENLERARNTTKKMGFKPNEVPLGGQLQPWQWLNHQALGEGSHGNQYNRNYTLPDADAVYRRMYQPAPSRLSKMLTVDTEAAATRPSRALLHPMTVVTNDRQREKEQRIPRNADVAEAVLYENIVPRGMGLSSGREAPRVYNETSVLRQPIGTNETGDKSVLGRWENPGNPYEPMTATTLEDRLALFKTDATTVRGQRPVDEAAQFARNNRALAAQFVTDTNQIQPQAGEYPDKTRQGINPASLQRVGA